MGSQQGAYDPRILPFQALSVLGFPLWGIGGRTAHVPASTAADTSSCPAQRECEKCETPTECEKCEPQKECPAEKFIEISMQDLTTRGRLTTDILAKMSKAADIFLERISEYWDVPAFKTKVYPPDADLTNKYQLYFMDEDPDVVGALGYHSKDGDTVISRILVETIGTHRGDGPTGILKPGTGGKVSVSAVMCHELIEMIGNPDVNRLYPAIIPVYQMQNQDHELIELDPDNQTVYRDVHTDDNGQPIPSIPVFVFAEKADPVKNNPVFVQVDGEQVQISDFITPAWFDEDYIRPIGRGGRSPEGVVFNYTKSIKKAFTLDPGGYLNFYLENKLDFVGNRSYTGRYYMFRND